MMQLLYFVVGLVALAGLVYLLLVAAIWWLDRDDGPTSFDRPL